MSESFHDRWERIGEDGDQYLKFELIEKPKSSYADIHALILLSEKFTPNYKGQDLICSSEHDQYWLNISSENLESLTDEEILELIRCGVSHDSQTDSLYLFT